MSTGLDIQGGDVLRSAWKICSSIFKAGKTVYDLSKDKEKNGPNISNSQISYGGKNTFNQHNQ